jgi:AraC-like DNA-binding protein
MCRQTAVARPGAGGVGALAAPFLTRIAAGLADGTVSPDNGDLTEATLDIIRALHGDHHPARTPEATGRGELLRRIQRHMDANLADPNLTPARIAAAHFVSVRLLHRLFAAQGTTVGRWLRDRRLERCRRDLAHPALGHLGTAEIAAAWGFRSPSHFSRAFRSAYGCAPSEARRHAA